MKTLQWMAAAHRRPLTLTRPGCPTVTVRPAGRRWTVHTAGRTVTMDAVRLEDRMEEWNLRGYREVPA